MKINNNKIIFVLVTFLMLSLVFSSIVQVKGNSVWSIETVDEVGLVGLDSSLALDFGPYSLSR